MFGEAITGPYRFLTSTADRPQFDECPEFRGVQVIHDFVNAAEGDAILAQIEARSFHPAQSGKLKQHFGAKFNFKKRRMKLGAFAGLPTYATSIERRMRERLPSDDDELARALRRYETTDAFVLRYDVERRSNLDPHIDDRFAYGELIANLSLQSDCVLTFLSALAVEATEPAFCIRIPIPARSLVVIYSHARERWHHGILADDIRGRRTSITLRTLGTDLRSTECGRRVLTIAKQRLDPPPT